MKEKLTIKQIKIMVCLFVLIFAGNVLTPLDRAIVIMDADTGQVLRLENPKMAVESSFPTGSLIKTFSSLYALREKLISPTETLQCNGSIDLEGHQFECWDPKGHGVLNLYKGLAYSCNIFFFQVGNRIDAPGYLDFIRAFGFGQKTGVNLPNEEPGSVPTSIDSIEKIKLTCGKSKQLLITPLQAAVAFAALVNGGKILKPFTGSGKTIVRDSLNLGSQLPHLHRALQEAATYGTASGFYQATGGIAKTGTAPWVDGFHTHGWFAGYIPLGDKKVIVLVFVYNGTAAKDAVPIAIDLGKKLVEQAKDHQKVTVSLLSLLKPKSITIEGRGGQLLLEEQGSDETNNCDGSDPEKKRHLCRKVQLSCSTDGKLNISAENLETIALQRLQITNSNPGGFFTLELPKRDKREYSGTLTIYNTGNYLEIINSLTLREYLKGVVGNELNGYSEAIKAQAVISRTYALKNLHRHDHFDLCDSTHCQVFSGRESLTQETGSDDKIYAAVEETSGLVLLYKNRLCEAFYHSTCGGHTNNYNGVWVDSNIPYLKEVDDKERCNESPHYRWQWNIGKKRFLNLLGEIIGGSPVDMRIKKVSRGGWVKQISITLADNRESVMSGEEFHIQMGRRLGWNTLKSANFTLQKNGDKWEFAGKGFGHGVGLCQWGATALARNGNDFREILNTYFPGSKVDYLWPTANGH